MDVKKPEKQNFEWGNKFVYLQKKINSENIEGGIFQCNPGQSLEKHTHQEGDEYCFLLEGEGIFVINGKEQKVKKGEVIKIPKKSNHRAYNKSDKPFISAYIVCS